MLWTARFMVENSKYLESERKTCGRRPRLEVRGGSVNDRAELFWKLTEPSPPLLCQGGEFLAELSSGRPGHPLFSSEPPRSAVQSGYLSPNEERRHDESHLPANDATCSFDQGRSCELCPGRDECDTHAVGPTGRSDCHRTKWICGGSTDAGLIPTAGRKQPGGVGKCGPRERGRAHPPRGRCDR